MIYWAGPYNGNLTGMGLRAIATDWKYALIAVFVLCFAYLIYRIDPMTNDPQYDP